MHWSYTDGLENFIVQHTRNMLPIGTPIPLRLIPLGPESSKLTLRIPGSSFHRKGPRNNRNYREGGLQSSTCLLYTSDAADE